VSVEGQQSSDSIDSFIAVREKDAAFSEATKIIFVGQTAYEGVDNGMVSSYGIIVKKGGNIIELVLDTGNLDGLAKNKAALTATEKLILSSFQFTN